MLPARRSGTVRLAERPTGDATVTIRLVLAEDPPPHADALARLLEREPDLRVVARCGDGETVPWGVRVFRPDVLLLGLDLPPGGAEVLRRLAREGVMPRVVVLSA